MNRLPGSPEPLVGRVRELARLSALVEETAAGTGSAVAVIGEPGLGKTRLVRALVGLAAGRVPAVAVGRCTPGSVASYRPIREALASWRRLSPTGARPHLLATATDSGAPLSPVLVGEEVLELLTSAGPAILVVEDLHWADPDSLAVVEYLADHVSEVSCGLLLTTRDGELAATDELVQRLAARRAASTLRLSPLGEADARRWTEERLGVVPDDLGTILHARSGGSPLLLEELLDELAEVDPAHRLAWARTALPSSIRDSVLNRLAQVSPSGVRVLQAAALCGLQDVTIVAAAAVVSEADALAGLDEGVAHRILALDPFRPGEAAFQHELVRESVSASLLAPARRAMAGRGLEALGAMPEDTSDEQVLERVVILAALAGDDRLAASAALRAAVLAFDRWALREAERWVSLAREHAGTDVELLTRVDVVHMKIAASAGRADLVRRLGEAVLARLPDDEEQVRLGVLLRLAQSDAHAGAGGSAVEWLRLAEPFLRSVGDACAVTCHTLWSAYAAQSIGDPTQAARLALAARRLAAPYDDQRDLECSALRVLGDSLWPDVAAARRAWQEGADLGTAHGMRLWRGRLLICLARADLLDGSGEDVIAEVEEIAREAGAPLLAAQAAALRAELALLRWRPDEVREHLRAVEALLSEVTLPAAVAADVATVSDVAEVLAGKHAAETPIGRTVLDLLDGVVPEPRPTGMSVTGLLVRSVVDPGFAMSWSGRAEGADTDPPSSPGDAPDVLSLGRTLSAMPWLGALRVMWTVPLLPAAERRGEQVDLLRRAAEVFDALPAGAGAARRCRDHLRERGASFPRRPSAQHGVPTSLSRQGITIREWDVLRLLEEGLTSRQIADRLFLSPRTVEKHVERMLAKTGAPNRAALAAISAAAVT